MNDEANPEQTEPTEQSERTKQPEPEAQPAQAEPAEESRKPKMSKPAELSIACLVAAFAVFVLYLKSGEAVIPLQLEKLIIPADIAILAIAFISAIVALVQIKAAAGALAGRRLALLGIIVPIVVAVAYIRSSSGTAEQSQVTPTSQCRSNISRLAEVISEYRRDNNGRLPAAGKWCDIVLERLGGDESLFACPLAAGARCSYALNKYAAEAGTDLPENMVLLFESAPGWNQVGGPELFAAQHRSRRGSVGIIVFGNGKARFISEEGLDGLNWKGVQDSESEEPEGEESQDE